MNLKNYTSGIPASTSVAIIEKYLVKVGATDISKKYNDGMCVSISFRMMINQQPIFFQLPAKVDACFKVFWGEIIRPKEGTEQRCREQAERTAWKIVSDWVEMQFTMIKLEQAEVIEIFLPYVYDPSRDETFFQKLKSGSFKALLTN